MKSAIDLRYLSTREKPRYICLNQDFVTKLTRPPVLKSAVDSRYLSTCEKPGYTCLNQDFVAKLMTPPVSNESDGLKIFIDSSQGLFYCNSPQNLGRETLFNHKSQRNPHTRM